MTPRDMVTQSESSSVPATVEAAQSWPVPAIVAAEGNKAGERFFTYFTDTIRNENTRAAYFRNACRFMVWCEGRGLTLKTIRSFHVPAYVEELGTTHEPPSVKQHLATIRMLFDWLIVGQVVELNPAQAVRGPKHVVKKGKTPVLNEDEARTLLNSIKGKDVVSLRDRALISVCLYSFARIEAALGMDVEDYYPEGKRWWFRLREKGGKHHEMPAHHKAEEYVDAYVEAAGLKGHKKQPLFRSAIGKSKQLSGKRMTRYAALKMVQRGARKVGILTPICCHSFRATGITNYLLNGGTLDVGQPYCLLEQPYPGFSFSRFADNASARVSFFN